jgi:hypothetical protein
MATTFHEMKMNWRNTVTPQSLDRARGEYRTELRVSSGAGNETSRDAEGQEGI